jgi:sulfoxide reductase catalytic subunit YedY
MNFCTPFPLAFLFALHIHKDRRDIMSYEYDQHIKASEITPKELYLNRRRFMKYGVGAAVATMTSSAMMAGLLTSHSANASDTLPPYTKSEFVVAEKLTSSEDFIHYTNFYEFGFGKRDPARQAKSFKTKPWSVVIEGEVNKSGVYTLEDILKPRTLEERIYRWRCVEAWSMVVPWIGFPLADLIKQFEPTSKAKYVEFTTLYDPEQMPEQKSPGFPWPYIEGLRMDEALHPLTIIAVGAYDEMLQNQNGAPLRLVVPWKYGFKSPKSIVKIRFLETQPATTWNRLQPQEYGFYANVNPTVDHPRWSQAQEERIGEPGMRDTLMFNGYAEQVASLYAGMDLRQYF